MGYWVGRNRDAGLRSEDGGPGEDWGAELRGSGRDWDGGLGGPRGVWGAGSQGSYGD